MAGPRARLGAGPPPCQRARPPSLGGEGARGLTWVSNANTTKGAARVRNEPGCARPCPPKQDVRTQEGARIRAACVRTSLGGWGDWLSGAVVPGNPKGGGNPKKPPDWCPPRGCLPCRVQCWRGDARKRGAGEKPGGGNQSCRGPRAALSVGCARIRAHTTRRTLSRSAGGAIPTVRDTGPPGPKATVASGAQNAMTWQVSSRTCHVMAAPRPWHDPEGRGAHRVVWSV